MPKSALGYHHGDLSVIFACHECSLFSLDMFVCCCRALCSHAIFAQSFCMLFSDVFCSLLSHIIFARCVCRLCSHTTFVSYFCVLFSHGFSLDMLACCYFPCYFCLQLPLISENTFWHLLQVHLEQMPTSAFEYHHRTNLIYAFARTLTKIPFEYYIILWCMILYYITLSCIILNAYLNAGSGRRLHSKCHVISSLNLLQEGS